MKKFLCVLLSLLVFAIPASAATYTLPEKLQRQLDFGSGLKGSFTLTMANILTEEINGTELQLRGQKDQQTGDYVYSIYRDDPENEENLIGLTQVFGSGDKVWFRSELNGGKVYLLPQWNEFLSMFQPEISGNPSLLTVFLSYAQLDDETRKTVWEPALAPYREWIEQWLTGFAAAPLVKKQVDSESIMTLNWDIPAASVKKGILSLLEKALSDETLINLVKPLMTEEQASLYLNPNWMYFFEAALNNLDLPEKLAMSRTITAYGETIATSVELPFPENSLDIRNLTMTNENGKEIYVITTEKDVWTVSMKKNETTENASVIAGSLIKKDLTGKDGWAVSWNLNNTNTVSTDENAKNHENTTWHLSADTDASVLPDGEDPEAYRSFQSTEVELILHYSSKAAQTSPTTLEVSLSAKVFGTELKGEGTFKTASPWILTPFDTSEAMNLTAEGLPGLLSAFVMLTEEKEETVETKDSEYVPESNEAAVPDDTASETAAPPVLEDMRNLV